MKKIGLSSILTVFLLMQTGTTKLEAWELDTPSTWFEDKKEKLEPVTFNLIYPIPFYKTGLFKWGSIAIVTVGIAVASVATWGVSAVPGAVLIGSLIAGGGSGAWMTGLAVLGGGTLANGGFGMAGGAIVIATITDLSIAGLTSFIPVPENKLEGKDYSTIKVKIPKDIGSEKVKVYYDDIEELTESYQDGELDIKAYEKKMHEDYVEALYSINPKETSYDLINGVILSFNLGEYKKAQYYLSKAISVFPENSSFIYYLQGLLHLVEYDIDSTMNNLDKAISIEPKALNPYLLKIQIAMDNGRNTLAKQVIDKGLKDYDDQNFQLNYLGGKVSYKMKNYDEAIEYFEEALSNVTINEVEAESKIWIAKCYKQLDKVKKANTWYKDAMDEIEDNKEYQTFLTDVYYQKDDE